MKSVRNSRTQCHLTHTNQRPALVCGTESISPILREVRYHIQSEWLQKNTRTHAGCVFDGLDFFLEELHDLGYQSGAVLNRQSPRRLPVQDLLAKILLISNQTQTEIL
jgi:hypothetical protein